MRFYFEVQTHWIRPFSGLNVLNACCFEARNKWRKMGEPTDFRCIECNEKATELHRDYSNGIVKITICVSLFVLSFCLCVEDDVASADKQMYFNILPNNNMQRLELIILTPKLQAGSK